MGLSKYKLGELISVCDERNSYGYTSFCGLNINKPKSVVRLNFSHF